MKKDSQTIHRENAERTAANERKRGKSRPRKPQASGDNEVKLTNFFAQVLALDIRQFNRSSKFERRKLYERRKT